MLKSVVQKGKALFASTLALPAAIFMLAMPLMVFAADGAAAPDLTAVILSLLNAIKDKAPVAVILVCVFQLLRTAPVLGILGKLSGKYLQLAIAIITALGYVAEAWARGMSLGAAAIEGLFTAGGAMLIYTAIRSIEPKA